MGNIRQHEPLRVPQGWNGQDRAFVIQLERVLTDLYRIFGILDGTAVKDVAYNSMTQKLTMTIDGEVSDIVRVATLDNNGKVPANQLPSYVDDVEEYASASAFPATGEADKIYVAKDTGFTYRWSGTQYVRLNTYDEATQSNSGLMSALDKTKLDGIAEGATANIGTITSIKMNGVTVSSSGEADLGTVLTQHQDISGKADKSTTVTNVAYDGANKKITITINGTTSDVVAVSTIKSALGAFTHDQLAGL